MHPEWGIAIDTRAMDPEALRKHAQDVKTRANRLFWRKDTGRFVACVDKAGDRHDFGFTFVNLDAIWYGIASDRHGRDIMEWITGNRIVDGDTSTGEDIYRWRFGPRATTRRNIEWYAHVWTGPETIPWGGQVQDGGAVLGFSFYDLWARLTVLGPDNAWDRLSEILAWEDEVRREGGYRAYYADGKRGTTLQGGGTAGGLGIDHEFFESSLLPAIVVYGFLGLDPRPDSLAIRPRLPAQCPEMGIDNVLYRGTLLDIRVGPAEISIDVKETPADVMRVALEGRWALHGVTSEGGPFTLAGPGEYRFTRVE